MVAVRVILTLDQLTKKIKNIHADVIESHSNGNLDIRFLSDDLAKNCFSSLSNPFYATIGSVARSPIRMVMARHPVLDALFKTLRAYVDVVLTGDRERRSMTCSRLSPPSHHYAKQIVYDPS